MRALNTFDVLFTPFSFHVFFVLLTFLLVQRLYFRTNMSVNFLVLVALIQGIYRQPLLNHRGHSVLIVATSRSIRLPSPIIVNLFLKLQLLDQQLFLIVQLPKPLKDLITIQTVLLILFPIFG